jgi:hypothetical protein
MIITFTLIFFDLRSKNYILLKMTRLEKDCTTRSKINYRNKTCTNSEFILVLLYLFLAVVIGICYQNNNRKTNNS